MKVYGSGEDKTIQEAYGVGGKPSVDGQFANVDDFMVSQSLCEIDGQKQFMDTIDYNVVRVIQGD